MNELARGRKNINGAGREQVGWPRGIRWRGCLIGTKKVQQKGKRMRQQVEGGKEKGSLFLRAGLLRERTMWGEGTRGEGSCRPGFVKKK